MELNDLANRTIYGLKSIGVNSIEDLCQTTEKDVRKIRSIGEKSLNDIKELMKANGLSFKEEESIDDFD